MSDLRPEPSALQRVPLEYSTIRQDPEHSRKAFGQRVVIGIAFGVISFVMGALCAGLQPLLNVGGPLLFILLLLLPYAVLVAASIVVAWHRRKPGYLVGAILAPLVAAGGIVLFGLLVGLVEFVLR